VALVISLGFSSTTARQAIGSKSSKAAPKAKHRPHWFQLGRASWYGKNFQGQPTASGEAFDMNQMTCAHRSLPLGALVRVTNLRNHRSVVVRVNDRGPMIPSRIVDLSYAAARVLGFHGRGTSRVRLDLIDARPTRSETAQLSWPDRTRN
jgi:rare lipoprotein A